MKPLKPDEGPVLRYLSQLPEKERAGVEAAVRTLLRTADGLTLLELLHYSVVERIVPFQQDRRALDDLNAQRFIVSDLNRIAKDENAYISPHPIRRPSRP